MNTPSATTLPVSAIRQECRQNYIAKIFRSTVPKILRSYSRCTPPCRRLAIGGPCSDQPSETCKHRCDHSVEVTPRSCTSCQVSMVPGSYRLRASTQPGPGL